MWSEHPFKCCWLLLDILEPNQSEFRIFAKLAAPQAHCEPRIQGHVIYEGSTCKRTQERMGKEEKARHGCQFRWSQPSPIPQGGVEHNISAFVSLWGKGALFSNWGGVCVLGLEDASHWLWSTQNMGHGHTKAEAWQHIASQRDQRGAGQGISNFCHIYITCNLWKFSIRKVNYERTMLSILDIFTHQEIVASFP